MKVHVAGHRGMVGGAILRRLEARRAAGVDLEIVTRTHAELDLTDQAAVRDFIAWTAQELGVRLEFRGEGVAEVTGDDAPALAPGQVVMRIDPRYFRPAEVDTLLGDPAKAKEELGWAPEITAREMCAEMVAEDLKAAQRHALLHRHGMTVPVAME